MTHPQDVEPAALKPETSSFERDNELLRRGDVVAMLRRLAGDHADLALFGEPADTRGREAMEASFTHARVAVAMMPAWNTRASPSVTVEGGVAPVAWRVKEGQGEWSDFWHDRENAERLSNKGWTIEPLYAAPQASPSPSGDLREAVARIEAAASDPRYPDFKGRGVDLAVVSVVDLQTVTEALTKADWTAALYAAHGLGLSQEPSHTHNAAMSASPSTGQGEG